MTGFITVIIIIAWIIIRNKGIADRVGKSQSMPNTTVTSAGEPARRKETMTVGTHPQAAGKKPAAAQEKRDAEDAREDGHSTTAYLLEKAEADERAHAREKYEEQKRLRESRGGLIVAERLYDGDPVPGGKRCVVCGYCGAENLVPMTARTQYSCYFCREPL